MGETVERHTHDKHRQGSTENKAIAAEHPGIVLSVDHPRRKGNADVGLLAAIWVPVELPVFAYRFISEAGTRQEKRDE